MQKKLEYGTIMKIVDGEGIVDLGASPMVIEAGKITVTVSMDPNHLPGGEFMEDLGGGFLLAPHNVRRQLSATSYELEWTDYQRIVDGQLLRIWDLDAEVLVNVKEVNIVEDR